jgi:uncharacterized protein with NAD-binding domain and iron-sulfur cluster
MLVLLLQDIRDLDNVSFADWWKSHGGNEHSLQRMWDPIGEQHLVNTTLQQQMVTNNKLQQQPFHPRQTEMS